MRSQARMPRAAALALAATTLTSASPVTLSKRASDSAISSCYDTWMPVADVEIAGGDETRPGFDSAVDRFCDEADGQTLDSGDSYLSFVTQVEHSGGNDPAKYGQLAFVEFEIHNRQDVDHTVNVDDCKSYLKELSAEGNKCWGSDNRDTKGGTWQVINGKLSYHAKPSRTPPEEDALNKLYTGGAVNAQSPNKGDGWPLDPWPQGVIDNILPVSAHSHNDYDREVPLFTALSTGCISVEADVFYSNGDAEIGHDSPSSGRTLRKQYIEPLAAILDFNGGVGVYKANTDAPSFTILVDFKSSASETLDVVSAALEPLRERGWLTTVEDGQLVERQVTVVASGNAPFDRIDSGETPDVLYDAKITELLADNPYNDLNSYYASAKYSDAGDDRDAQIAAAHELGLKVRYWDIDEDDWEELAAAGVDRLNADDLANTARLPRI